MQSVFFKPWRPSVLYPFRILDEAMMDEVVNVICCLYIYHIHHLSLISFIFCIIIIVRYWGRCQNMYVSRGQILFCFNKAKSNLSLISLFNPLSELCYLAISYSTQCVIILQIKGQQPMVYAVVRHPYERLVSSYLDFGTRQFRQGYQI